MSLLDESTTIQNEFAKHGVIKSKAAVAFEAGKPLQIVEIDVAPPKAKG